MHPWNQPILDSLARRSERLPHALLLFGPKGSASSRSRSAWPSFFFAREEEAVRRVRRLPLVPRRQPPRLPPSRARGIGQGAASRVDEEAPRRGRRSNPASRSGSSRCARSADFLNVGSHRGGLRVALVHPAEHMNPPTANALLKGLEEPPASAVFILVSHRPAQLLPTIRSRCVALPVPLPAREAAAAVAFAAGSEGHAALACLRRRRAPARGGARRAREGRPRTCGRTRGAGTARRSAAEDRPGPRAPRVRSAGEVRDHERCGGA